MVFHCHRSLTNHKREKYLLTRSGERAHFDAEVFSEEASVLEGAKSSAATPYNTAPLLQRDKETTDDRNSNFQGMCTTYSAPTQCKFWSFPEASPIIHQLKTQSHRAGDQLSCNDVISPLGGLFPFPFSYGPWRHEQITLKCLH